jgi:signal transduction histidine kinase
VQRAYQPVPLVNAVGTELNQVWTNIIENAIDAMLGQGELRVRTSASTNLSWLKSAIAVLEFPLR